MYRQAFDVIKNAHGKEAEIVRNILCTYVSYAYSRIGEVTEEKYGISGIDKVMSTGFNWASPSLIVNLLGGKNEVSNLLVQNGLNVPSTLEETADKELQLLQSGKFFVAR